MIPQLKDDIEERNKEIGELKKALEEQTLQLATSRKAVREFRDRARVSSRPPRLLNVAIGLVVVFISDDPARRSSCLLASVNDISPVSVSSSSSSSQQLPTV